MGAYIIIMLLSGDCCPAPASICMGRGAAAQRRQLLGSSDGCKAIAKALRSIYAAFRCGSLVVVGMAQQLSLQQDTSRQVAEERVIHHSSFGCLLPPTRSATRTKLSHPGTWSDLWFDFLVGAGITREASCAMCPCPPVSF